MSVGSPISAGVGRPTSVVNAKAKASKKVRCIFPCSVSKMAPPLAAPVFGCAPLPNDRCLLFSNQKPQSGPAGTAAKVAYTGGGLTSISTICLLIFTSHFHTCSDVCGLVLHSRIRRLHIMSYQHLSQYTIYFYFVRTTLQRKTRHLIFKVVLYYTRIQCTSFAFGNFCFCLYDLMMSH
jgi:hypothetical protein